MTIATYATSSTSRVVRLAAFAMSLLVVGLTGCATTKVSHLAYEGANSELAAMSVEDMETRGNPRDALFRAADARRVETIRLLMDKGIPVGVQALTAAVTDVPLSYTYYSLSGFPSGNFQEPAYNTKAQRSGSAALRQLLSGEFYPAILDQTFSHYIGAVDASAPTSTAIYFSGTPLMYAARWGSLEDIELLLDKGADPNATAPSWKTYPESGNGLNSAGKPSKAALTALHVAAFYDRPDVVEVLVRRGGDPNARTADAHCDFSASRMEVFDWLAQFKDNHLIDGTTLCIASGSTPLHFAAVRNGVDAAQALVGAGAQVQARNDRGEAVDDLAGRFFAVAQKARNYDALQQQELEQARAMWGRLLAVGFGNAVAADNLTAEQFSRFSSAFTKDVMSGTTSNMQGLNEELRQELQAADDQVRVETDASRPAGFAAPRQQQALAAASPAAVSESACLSDLQTSRLPSRRVAQTGEAERNGVRVPISTRAPIAGSYGYCRELTDRGLDRVTRLDPDGTGAFEYGYREKRIYEFQWGVLIGDGGTARVGNAPGKNCLVVTESSLNGSPRPAYVLAYRITSGRDHEGNRLDHEAGWKWTFVHDTGQDLGFDSGRRGAPLVRGCRQSP